MQRERFLEIRENKLVRHCFRFSPAGTQFRLKPCHHCSYLPHRRYLENIQHFEAYRLHQLNRSGRRDIANLWRAMYRYKPDFTSGEPTEPILGGNSALISHMPQVLPAQPGAGYYLRLEDMAWETKSNQNTTNDRAVPVAYDDHLTGVRTRPFTIVMSQPKVRVLW